MSQFQQHCPECNSVLELPMEADGKAAICPACEARFTARAESPSSGTEDGSDSGELVIENQESVATTQGHLVVPATGFQQVSIETIFGDTQTIYSDRRTPLLLPFLIPSAVIILGVVLPLAHLSHLAVANLRGSLIWTAVLAPWFVAVISYTLWFALNLSRDVCDAGPPSGDTVAPAKRSWFVPSGRALVAMVVTVSVVMLTIGFLATACYSVLRIATKVNATEIMVLISFVGIAGVIVGGITAATRLWPIVPLAIRGHWGMSVFQYAFAMTRVNLMTSFLIVTIVCFMLGVGFGLLGIGLFYAIPIAMLLMTVACRSMEGDEIPALWREF